MKKRCFFRMAGAVAILLAPIQPMQANTYCDRPNAYRTSICPNAEVPSLRDARKAWEAGDRATAIGYYEDAWSDFHASGKFLLDDLKRIEEAWSDGLGTADVERLFALRKRLYPNVAAKMLAMGEVPLRKDESYLTLLATVYDNPSDEVSEDLRIAALKKAASIYRSNPTWIYDKQDYLTILARLAGVGEHQFALVLYIESDKRNDTYLLPAAEAGQPDAQYTLGGIAAKEADQAIKAKDWEVALEKSEVVQKWMERAAAQGFNNSATIAASNAERIEQLKPLVAKVVAEREAEAARRAEAAARRQAAARERALAEPLALSRSDLKRALSGWLGETVRRQARQVLSVGGAWHPSLISCGPVVCRYGPVEIWLEIRGTPECDTRGTRAWCSFEYSMEGRNLVPHSFNPMLSGIASSQVFTGSARLRHNGEEWKYDPRR